MMLTAYLCILLLGLLIFIGGFAVSLARGKAERIAGVPDDPGHPLTKIARAHGNTAEYAPILAMIIFALAQTNPPTWSLYCMGLATLSRYLIFYGIVTCPTMASVYLPRAVGAMGTYIFGTALCIALALQVAIQSA